MARLVAWLIDWACIAAWAVVLGVIGFFLLVSGAFSGLSPLHGNGLAFLVLIAPVTVWLAWLESRPAEGSIGKRARSLRVVDREHHRRIGFGRALWRNALKIALPWELAHTVVFGLATADPQTGISGWWYFGLAASYLLPVVYLASLFSGSGRTPYDWAAGTVVLRST